MEAPWGIIRLKVGDPFVSFRLILSLPSPLHPFPLCILIIVSSPFTLPVRILLPSTIWWTVFLILHQFPHVSPLLLKQSFSRVDLAVAVLVHEALFHSSRWNGLVRHPYLSSSFSSSSHFFSDVTSPLLHFPQYIASSHITFNHTHPRRTRQDCSSRNISGPPIRGGADPWTVPHSGAPLHHRALEERVRRFDQNIDVNYGGLSVV